MGKGRPKAGPPTGPICMVGGIGFVAAVLALVGSLAVWSSTALAAPVSETVRHTSRADFRDAELADVVWKPGTALKGWDAGLVLGASAGGHVSSGTVTSRPIVTAFPFNNVVPSWNVVAPDKTGAVVEVRARSENGEWTAWYQIARWGRLTSPAGLAHKKDDAGYVNEDTLELESKATALQYRVTLLTEDPNATPILRLVAACYADTDSQAAVPAFAPPANPSQTPWVRELPVPFRSQRSEDPSIAGRICSPTSVAIVMDYHGISVPTAAVAAQAYDSLNDIYGNWPFNTAAAALYGFEAYVTRFPGFEPVQEEIARGYPVIISVRFRSGELAGGPLKSSSGHLVVIRGFTKDGDVIVNDPAGRTEAEGHVVYKRDELLRAWKSGIAYVIRPMR